MTDRDFVTRFVSFYLNCYTAYQPDLDGFLTASMMKIKSLSQHDKEEMKTNFIQAMESAYKIFKEDAFRKRFNPNERRKPINKALFETISVNLAKLSEDQAKALIEQKELFKKRLMELMNTPSFEQSISRATGQKKSVETRFSEIERLIKEILNSN
ncbi:MAG: sulfotransferase family 2 domain-containing protein [Bacteroidia bacterium]|nr:sulfotransferase family 2 domain-containing protein [Bacteroidia bacterium]